MSERRRDLRRAVWLPLVALLVALPGGVGAQSGPLTLDEARRTALEASIDLRDAEMRLWAVSLQVDQAWSRLIPRLSAQGGWQVNDRTIVVPLPQLPDLPIEEPVLQYQSLFRFRATAEMQLIDPGFFPALRAARESVEAGEHQVTAVRLAVDLAAIELFHQVVALDALVEVARADVTMRQQNVTDVANRLAAETVTQLELSRAQTEQLEAQVGLEDLLLAREQASRALAELMGVAEVGAVENPGPMRLEELDLDVQTAIAERDEVVAARLAVDAAESTLRAARNGYWPALVANGEYLAVSEPFIDGANQGWSVNLAVSWLILDRGLLRVRAERAEIELERSRIALEDAERAARRELNDALGELSTAERRLELAARRVELAEEALEQANRSFAAEVITNLDVLEAQTALRGAQAGRVRAALTLNRAGWRVRRLLDDL